MSSVSLVENILHYLDKGFPKLKGVNYAVWDGNRIGVHQTPYLWGYDPGSMNYYTDGDWTTYAPPPASKNFLGAIALMIGEAQSWVDISCLGKGKLNGNFPSGAFQEALRQGFRTLALNGRKPSVRILVGMPIGATAHVNEMHDWLTATVGVADFPVTMCTQHPDFASWNHAKIIAADGKDAMVGGHNLWGDTYMAFAPVHDVTMRVTGPAVHTAHSFLNRLWRHPLDVVTFLKGQSTFGYLPPPPWTGAPGPATGTSRLLAIGRMGAGLETDFTRQTDASVTARIFAILHAKHTIRISQQSLGFAPFALQPHNVATMAALAHAICKGVKVEIVISGDGATDAEGDSYCPVPNIESLARISQYVEYERNNPGSDHVDHYFRVRGLDSISDMMLSKATVDLVKQNVHMARLRFSTDPDPRWRAVWRDRYRWIEPANHAKVYIIDDSHFYVGSDNMYNSGGEHGLQEYGHLVEDTAATRAFIEEYWSPLWSYSGRDSARVQ